MRDTFSVPSEKLVSFYRLIGIEGQLLPQKYNYFILYIDKLTNAQLLCLVITTINNALQLPILR